MDGEPRGILSAQNRACTGDSAHALSGDSEKNYRSLFESMDEGFCIIQMVFDQQERPIDYRFLEVNRAFERQTGLRGAQGKTMRELAPQHEQHWFEMYGRIAVTGEPARFINRAEQLHRWYDVHAWRFGEASARQVAVLFNDITERTIAEMKRRDSEERFRAVFDQQFQFMAVLSPEGRTLEVNNLALNATGVEREQVIGKLFWETPYWAHLPEMRKCWPERLRKAAQAVGPVLSEDQYESADGMVRMAHAAITAVKNPNGDVRMFIFQATDITEHKRAEQALRESEERLSLALAAGDTGAWDLDLTKRQAKISNSYRELFGLGPDEPFSYEAWLGRVHPDDRERCRAYGDQFFASRSATDWNLEFRIVTPHLGVRWHRAVGTLKRSSDGTPLRFIGVSSDVTDLKQAEERLRESERRFRAFTSTTSDVVYQMNADWTEMIQLHGGREFMANAPEASRSWLDRYIHPDDRQMVREAISQAIEARSMFELEHRVVRRDGSLGWTHSRAIPILDEQGEIIEWFGAASDITQRKEAEEALRHHRESLEENLRQRTAEILLTQKSLALSQRMAAVGTLAAGLAHDMNNLLLPLGARLDVLLSHRKVEGDVHNELVVISALLDHLRDLSKNLALFSRDPEKEGIVGRTNLEQWHGSVHKLLNASVGRDIVVKWDDPAGLPDIAIAPHRLTQAVQNLMHNARDAVLAARGVQQHPYLPRIAIQLRRAPDNRAVHLTVSDNGIGMDEETRQRCIEPFFTTRDRTPARADDVRSAAPLAAGTAGSGLGLSLAHQIVERAGGSLHIESSPGNGTSITLSLPVAPTAQQPAA